MAENDIKTQLDDMRASAKETQESIKSMADAIANAMRPLQHTNSMMEAIAAEAEEMTKSVKASVDMMNQLNKAAQEYTKSHKEAVPVAKELTDLEKQRVVAQTEYINARAEKTRLENETKRIYLEEREMSRQRKEDEERSLGYWDSLIHKTKEWTQELASGTRYYDRQKQEWVETKAASPMAHSVVTGLSSSLFGSSPADALSSIGKMFGGFMPAVGGIGGIIGMGMAGLKTESEWTARGNRIAQAFEPVGEGIQSDMGGRYAGISRQMQRYGYSESGEELVGVAKAFAEVGISAKEATSEVEGFNSRFGKDLIVASMAADKAFEMQSGSFAKLAGVMKRDFNMAATEATALFVNLGTEAQKAGFNAATFLQQTMEMNAGLKMMAANAENTGNTMLRLGKTIAGRFGAGSEQYAQQYAAAGMQNAMTSIGGMSEGLAAVIGEDLSNSGKYGPSVSGLDALYMMRTGSGASSRGDKMIDPLDTVNAIFNRLDPDQSRSRSEMSKMLQGIVGVNQAGADAMMDIRRAQETGDTTLMAESQKKLQESFETEKDKLDQIELGLKAIKDVITEVMGSLLVIAVDVLKGILNGVVWIGSALMGIITDLDGNKDAAAAWKSIRDTSSKNLGEISDDVVMRGAGIFSSLDDVLKDQDDGVKAHYKKLLQPLQAGTNMPTEATLSKAIGATVIPGSTAEIIDKAVDSFGQTKLGMLGPAGAYHTARQGIIMIREYYLTDEKAKEF